jgi:hypothetical protein
MRILPRTAGLALVLLVAAALSGCVASKRSVLPDPLPSATPIFATDEDALAAAKDAYAAYLAVSDAILADGGARPERLLDVATESVFESEASGFQKFADRGWHSLGSSKAEIQSVQSYDPLATGGRSLITVYACIDVAGVDVLDMNGVSVVSASRPDKTPFQTSFDLKATGEDSLMVSAKDAWTGSDFCN